MSLFRSMHSTESTQQTNVLMWVLYWREKGEGSNNLPAVLHPFLPLSWCCGWWEK